MSADNRILKKLLDRLFGSLINGPSLNCRPHSSRQRIDLLQFAKLKDESPEDILRELLGPKRQVKVSAKVPPPKGRAASPYTVAADDADDEEGLTPEEKAARQASRDQQSVLSKLRAVAEDSRVYENDTGVHVLQIGFPLLSLPPGSGGGLGSTRRILAPLAFISLLMTIKGGPTPSIVLECRNDGADLVVPNIALLAWLESQTGQAIGELFTDETGEQPWVELVSIAKRVCDLVQVPLPALHDQPTAAVLAPLVNRFDSLETVLRVREGLAALPSELSAAAVELIGQNVGSDVGLSVLRKTKTSAEIMQRLRSDRRLMATDAHQLQSSFARYLELDATKKLLTRQAITHRWGAQQKQRLLAATGGRLNSSGADLRRRLMIRGERAMRLRQVVNVGQNIEGGDPLYDLRPVWMASPETVAQIFPRLPLFDVVIFDEASQCRLEEAMPVLLRAKRVVIAGDPKQLPPTRFFESAVAASEDVEAENEQQLFESQQGEIEDLLAAALNIEIEECYLDVHYRSRNSALIEFSNDKFYNRRLQAIPGHPKNRTRFAPLTLYKANGVYEKRTNVMEADRVIQIVRDLLKRADPPTIGIACFNIAQKDLINEKLDEAALADPAFGRTLAAARERRTESSFEGLFVKNLENVQGDERDHIIISTTYGPDPKGRFYRRFGPVGNAGGGRRLNVLVTRARDEVHLVTSIPETVYRNLPPVPPGESPGGAWLLFAYLVYAEQLADLYEREHESASHAQAASSPVVNVRPTRFPSTFAAQLANRLHSQAKFGSDVYWGNDGFCMDVALHHPNRVEDVTVGVMCDMNRFEQAADPVEWEVFRTAILEGQGWKVSRVWTPHFFRDPAAGMQSIQTHVSTVLASDIDPDVLPVSA